MNKYLITIALFTIFYGIAMTIFYKVGSRDKNATKILKSRNFKNDRSTRNSRSSLKSQLTGMINEKADVSKKYKLETMCLQAGYDISFGEFKILSVSIAIALTFIMLLIMNNLYLAVIFLFIGYHIPSQYIKHMSNRRVIKMENQVGSFLRIVLERYKTNKDLSKSIVQSLPDFKGHEPFYSELKQTVVDINLGTPCEEALEALSRRTGNKYLLRFSDYYKITANIATHESKLELLNQAFKQFDENRKMKFLLKKEIAGPVREAYIMVCATPIFIIYQFFTTKGYMDFMLHNQIGQIGIAGTVVVLLGAVWFINAKIGAPLD